MVRIAQITTTMASTRFTGFPPTLVRFLDELAANNRREWFQVNKARYEEQVRGPALDFIEAFAVPLADFAPCFVAWPKKVGGSLMRPYRDIRFSKDKTPYKTNVGIQFRHEQGKDVHAPGYYVHIDPDQVFLAAGTWRPDPDFLGRIRERIAGRPQEWTAVITDRQFKRQLSLSGTALSRPPRGFAKTDEHIQDIKRKDFIAVTELSHERLETSRFMKDVEKCFRAADPLMRFLCKAAEVPFDH
jgi:uncharacterized protein (TIGR02453 family)